MSHETRQQIAALLRNKPGMNGGEIARALGFSSSVEIASDVTFLRKSGVIRREGENVNSRWYAVEGAAVHKAHRGPKKGWHGHKHLCAYHQEHRRSGMGHCHRCSEAADAVRRGKEVVLRRVFPRIFSAEGGAHNG